MRGALIAMAAQPPQQYTHFRLIAYQVPTVVCLNKEDPRTKPTKNYTCIGLDPGSTLCDIVPDMPIGPVSNTDLKKRLLRLARVVDLAYNLWHDNYGYDTNERGVLNVFVVPEFYFRPASPAVGVATAYTSEVYNEFLSAIASMFSNKKFEDWFFVCGTIVYKDFSILEGGEVIYNESVCVQGGSHSTLNRLCPVRKIHTSSYDEIDKDIQSDRSKYSDVRQSMLDVDLDWRVLPHLGIGVEICLEHSMQVLRRARCILYAANRDRSIGLQVLTAGGMLIMSKGVAVNSGGCVFRNDGFYVSPRRSQVRCCIINGYTRPVPSVVPDYCDLPSDVNGYQEMNGYFINLHKDGSPDPPEVIQPPPNVLPVNGDTTFYRNQGIVFYGKIERVM